MTFTPETWIQAAIAAANRQAEDTGGESGIVHVQYAFGWDEETEAMTVLSCTHTSQEIKALGEQGKVIYVTAYEDTGFGFSGDYNVASSVYINNTDMIYSQFVIYNYEPDFQMESPVISSYMNISHYPDLATDPTGNTDKFELVVWPTD